MRPGAPPVTLTSTTGRPRRRNASARVADRSTISLVGWTVGASTVPFRRSMTTSAALGSIVVSGIVVDLFRVGVVGISRAVVGEAGCALLAVVGWPRRLRSSDASPASTARAAEKPNTSDRPWWKRSGDRRQRDDHNRAVELRHELRRRRVRQHHPPITVSRTGRLLRLGDRRHRLCAHRLCAKRSIRGAATISCRSSPGLKPRDSACASCSARALCLSPSTRRPALVIDRTERRPSLG